MGFQDWVENVRKWIDGEEAIDEDKSPRPRSKWEDFLVAVARQVEQTMLSEMFTPPGGPTYIPREYIVFLSTADDADWQGEKREGLQRGLYHVLSERAKELVGTQEFQTRSFSVELRVDGTLETGKFRVQHVWDTASPKTMVKPRRASSPQQSTSTQPVAPSNSGLGRQESEVESRVSVDSNLSGVASQASVPDDEATIVRPRTSKEPLFFIRVQRAGSNGSKADATADEVRNEAAVMSDGDLPSAETKDSAETAILASGANTAEGGPAKPAGDSGPLVRPFYKNEITIGRGSRQIAVDLQLEGDMEVSRKHATLRRRDGLFELTCHGANALVVNGEREIATGETGEIKPGDKVAICSYELQVAVA